MRRWHSILKTFLCTLLVIPLLVVSGCALDPSPTTLDGVREETLAEMGLIEEIIPADAILGQDSIEDKNPCVVGGTEIVIAHTFSVSPEFDRLAWLHQMETHFKELGWDVRVSTLTSSSHVQASLVSRKLLYYFVILTDGDETSTPPAITIRSTSRCTTSDAN